MNEYNYEIYTINPKTGETGRDIHYVSVLAETKKEATKLLTKYPNYDCIISYNYGDVPFEKDNRYLRKIFIFKKT